VRLPKQKQMLMDTEAEADVLSDLNTQPVGHALIQQTLAS
jgi:hypothetical protein